MKIIKTPKMPNDFRIFDISDLHVGSPNCSLKHIEEMIDVVKMSKHTYVIFKGDAIECITPFDKRFQNGCVQDDLKSPMEQGNKVIEMFKPIADKILSWGIGNHELKIRNTIDIGRHISDTLGVPYGAYNCIIEFTAEDGSLMFKTYHTHGSQTTRSNAKDSIQYEANLKAGIKHRFSKLEFADTIYMSHGHDHQLMVVEPTIQNQLSLYTKEGKLHQRFKENIVQNSAYIPPDARWYATTGSFRKMFVDTDSDYIDYSEIAGYRPSSIGFVCVDVKDRNIVNVEKVIV